ncbi:hypothetical protein, partial [Escherichia coli]|uniref:hypothetical protein n=1 Tax=Escherichia coli TaxID=562 RepID=UPI001A8C7045
ADRNRSHWSTSKTPSYTKSVSWQHHPHALNYLAGYLNTKHYCRMDNKARNNFQLIRQNNVNEAG